MRSDVIPALVIILAAHCAAFQETQINWQKSALSRRGIHHANITGRFVTPSGAPAEGVRVQFDSGLPRRLPIAEAVSGTDGRFRFADVSSSAAPGIHWYPSERWMKGAMAVAGESFEDIDVGEIRLEPNSVIRVMVEMVGGGPLDPQSLEYLMPVLEGTSNGPRIVGMKQGDSWVLQQIPFREGHWEIFFSNSAKQYEWFRGDFHVERGRRDQLLLLRLRRDALKPEGKSRFEGQIEATEVIVPEANVERDFRMQGKLLAPDGSPVGAIFSVSDVFSETAAAWAFSDSHGVFDLRYRAAKCNFPFFALAHGEGISTAWRGNEEACQNASQTPQTVTLPGATRLVMKAAGAESGVNVKAYWWHDSLGWQPFSGMRPWISLASWHSKVLLKADAPGYLPALTELELPRIDEKKGEKPPEQIQTDFDFEGSVARELAVVSGGKPVPGATVDVECIRSLSRDQRTPLATYRTGSDGTLRLQGGRRQVVEAFIYARGYEPSRLIWEPRERRSVELVPRQARLLFARLRPGYLARVRRAGQPDAVRTLRADFGKGAAIAVSAGDYDVVIYGDTGHVLGYQRVPVAAGETRPLDVSVDQPPRLIVRYPDDGWSAGVSDSTPSGTAVGWAIYSTAGGQFTIHEIAAVLENESSREAVFRLSRAGKFGNARSCPYSDLS